MLIKIVYNDNEVGYLSERHIDFVREMPDGKSWRVHSLGDTWFLNKDKNEPFKTWLDNQIGGDVWQRETDRWKKQQRTDEDIIDAALEAASATLEAIEKVEQCQLSIT